jgi:hypothetical protein
MTTMKFMTSNKPVLLGSAPIFILVFCLSYTLPAQPSSDLARFQAKYPGNFVITESLRRDVSFEVTRNGEPQLTFSDYSSLFVLGENPGVLSESKEYFNSKSEIKELEAYSLVPNQNSYKKYPVGDFTKTHELGNGVFYDDMYSYNFNFPAVGKGTKLVTTSETITHESVYPIIFFFGNRIPADRAALTLTLPEKTDIIYRLFGYDTTGISFSKTRKGKFTVYQWSTEGTRSYIPDGESPSARYITPHIIIHIAGYQYQGKYVSALGSLKDLYAWDYSKISSLNTVPAPEIKRLADSLTDGLPFDREKVRQIFSWVQQNIKYVAIEDGDNGYVPREASLVLQRRYGDCKDKSSILTALLRSVGLKSGLAWVGTRTLPYKYSEFPSIANSNHMIAIWWDENNSPLILDGTTLYHSLDEIPASIQGKQCIIEKSPDEFVLYPIPVTLPSQNLSIDTAWLKVDNGVLTGKGKAVFTGERKADLLSAFDGVDSTIYKDKLSRVIPMASNKFAFAAVSLSDLKQVGQPFLIAYDFTLPDYITTNQGSYYINLNIERFMNDVQIKPDRWMPVDVETPFVHRFVSVLEIPENMALSTLPEPSSYEHTGFSFRQQYARSGNSVVVTTEIRVNSQLISGDDLKGYREMLAVMKQAYVKSIVLTKKSA